MMQTAFEGLRRETGELFMHLMLRIKFTSGGFVTFDTASRIASQVMVPVYAQLGPEALGNDLRDLNVAMEYGKRLVEEGRNVKPYAIEKLVYNYPSHEFIIDRKEARELFKQVNPPDNDLSDLTTELGELIYNVRSAPIIKRLDQLPQGEDYDVQSREERRDKVTQRDEERESAGESVQGNGATDESA